MRPRRTALLLAWLVPVLPVVLPALLPALLPARPQGPWSAAAAADDPAEAGDLAALVARYEAEAARTRDEAYAAQRRLAEEIADLRRPAAQKALEVLLNKQGAGDRRRAAVLLSAYVRRGGPPEVDFAIDFVERTHDPLWMDLLDGVLASALEPAARAHVRLDALPRAVPAVKAQIARTLGAWGEPAAVVPLLGLLREENLIVRAEAVGALAQLHDPRAQGPLVALLMDGDPRLRDAAARALGVLPAPAALPHLVKLLSDPASVVVEGAAHGLALLGLPAAVPALIDRLELALEDDLRLSDALALALERITGKALGCELAQWRSWWDVAKNLPWKRAEDAAGGAAGGTVGLLRYYGFPVRSSKVVFVLDVSRSMGWNGRLETARSELLQVVEHLPRATRFNLITFSDKAVRWEGGLVAATAANVRRAMSFVRRQEPVNATAAHDALQMAFSDPEADTVFFLSDGHPSSGAVVDPELILSDVRGWNRFRRVKVHVVALLRGEPPAAFAGMENAAQAERFMKQLADENEGRFKVVR